MSGRCKRKCDVMDEAAERHKSKLWMLLLIAAVATHPIIWQDSDNAPDPAARNNAWQSVAQSMIDRGFEVENVAQLHYYWHDIFDAFSAYQRDVMEPEDSVYMVFFPHMRFLLGNSIRDRKLGKNRIIEPSTGGPTTLLENAHLKREIQSVKEAADRSQESSTSKNNNAAAEPFGLYLTESMGNADLSLESTNGTNFDAKLSMRRINASSGQVQESLFNPSTIDESSKGDQDTTDSSEGQVQWNGTHAVDFDDNLAMQRLLSSISSLCNTDIVKFLLPWNNANGGQTGGATIGASNRRPSSWMFDGTSDVSSSHAPDSHVNSQLAVAFGSGQFDSCAAMDDEQAFRGPAPQIDGNQGCANSQHLNEQPADDALNADGIVMMGQPQGFLRQPNSAQRDGVNVGQFTTSPSVGLLDRNVPEQSNGERVQHAREDADQQRSAPRCAQMAVGGVAQNQSGAAHRQQYYMVNDGSGGNPHRIELLSNRHETAFSSSRQDARCLSEHDNPFLFDEFGPPSGAGVQDVGNATDMVSVDSLAASLGEVINIGDYWYSIMGDSQMNGVNSVQQMAPAQVQMPQPQQVQNVSIGQHMIAEASSSSHHSNEVDNASIGRGGMNGNGGRSADGSGRKL